jgi:positive regulator of sigma E activity
MKELAKVTSVKGARAIVSVDRKDECSKCGMCLFPKNASSVEFPAINTMGAKVGDTVTIEKKDGGNLLGALLAFLVPLVLIGISVLIGYLVLNSELWILGLSVIFIFLWYTILAVIDKKLKNTLKFSVEIVEITKKGEEINDDNGDNREKGI